MSKWLKAAQEDEELHGTLDVYCYITYMKYAVVTLERPLVD
jgi:hypothetical protein